MLAIRRSQPCSIPMIRLLFVGPAAWAGVALTVGCTSQPMELSGCIHNDAGTACVRLAVPIVPTDSEPAPKSSHDGSIPRD